MTLRARPRIAEFLVAVLPLGCAVEEQAPPPEALAETEAAAVPARSLRVEVTSEFPHHCIKYEYDEPLGRHDAPYDLTLLTATGSTAAPVPAPCDGRLLEIEDRNRGACGKHVIVRCDGGWDWRLCHFAELAFDSSQKGRRITRGTRLGIQGATDGGTGRTTGPHVHFELYPRDHEVNPIAPYKQTCGLLDEYLRAFSRDSVPVQGKRTGHVCQLVPNAACKDAMGY